jgi:hypothetical protein
MAGAIVTKRNISKLIAEMHEKSARVGLRMSGSDAAVAPPPSGNVSAPSKPDCEAQKGNADEEVALNAGALKAVQALVAAAGEIKDARGKGVAEGLVNEALSELEALGPEPDAAHVARWSASIKGKADAVSKLKKAGAQNTAELRRKAKAEIDSELKDLLS